jgi:uncharacterized membrane protein
MGAACIVATVAIGAEVCSGAAVVGTGVATVVVTGAGAGWLAHPATNITTIQRNKRINPVDFCIFF